MKSIPIIPVQGTRANIETPATCASSALVALQVLDASMAPEFDTGHVVVVDRTGRLKDGAFVLVEIEHQLVLRQWRTLESDCIELVPLNSEWESLRCTQHDARVQGVVVQRSGRRRADRKRYA